MLPKKKKERKKGRKTGGGKLILERAKIGLNELGPRDDTVSLSTYNVITEKLFCKNDFKLLRGFTMGYTVDRSI